MKTFLTPGKYIADLDSKKAIIPGDGNIPVSFTHTLDVARYVVASLSLPLWPRLLIRGDYSEEFVQKRGYQTVTVLIQCHIEQ